jgi:hypothetical protein
MSSCSIQASYALLIEPGYVHSEVVMHYLLITNPAPVLERVPRSVSQVRPYNWTVL